MGILRTDRVTGLGGANAIKGSVFFPQNSYIDVSPDAGLDLSGDFTVEMWVYNLPSPQITSHARQISTKNYYQAGSDGNWYFGLNRNSNTNFDITFYSYDGTGSAEYVNGSVGSDLEKWYHIAASRSGSTLKLFVDGVEKASGTLSKGLDDGGNNGLLIGGMAQSGGEASTWGDHYGYISNLRIIKGTALYTAAFTAPAFELNQTSDTTLLCCQSPGNILQEKTGKILTILTHNSAGTGGSDEGAVATRFTPNSPVGFSTTSDVGSQHGSTFDGFGNFSTSTYMVPPGGNTRERNRGRGVLGGGYVHPNLGHNSMMYIEIQTQGNAQDFGDLGTARSYFPAGQTSSSTRGLSSGGWNNGGINTIEFITIANTSNATDFGDTSIARMSGGLSNQTRAVHAGTTSPFSNIIDFVTIATTGDAQNFGDLVEPQSLFAGASSSTRGVFGGGRNNTPSENTLHNTMQYITIATTGDAQDFGDLQATRYGHTGFSSPTRGIFAGGYLSPGQTASIDYFTIATLGNSFDFGDLSIGVGYNGSVTNSTRGVITINDAPNYTNALEFITIATTGDAQDFGDADPSGSPAGNGMGDFPSCMSDSHGGLS